MAPSRARAGRAFRKPAEMPAELSHGPHLVLDLAKNFDVVGAFTNAETTARGTRRR
jgi:hypothetical protein